MTINEPFSLHGKTLFVTGAASGLGAALCELLAQDGTNLVLADINLEAAEALAARLGSNAMAMRVDVGSERDVHEAMQAAVQRFGRMDAVINNAAIDITVPIEELPVADWERVLRTNLTGPFIVSREASVHMRAQGSGHIVNISSTAGKRAWPNASVYHASKWGVLGFSHALHAELRPHGIKVTAIVAGGMKTPFLLDRFPDIDPELLQDPANVARTVRFVLMQPAETVIPEVMVLPMRETSWP